MRFLNILFFSLFLFVFSGIVTGQVKKKNKDVPPPSFHRCGTTTVMQELIRKNPGLKTKMEAIRKENQKRLLQHTEWITSTQSANYTIPVVVHIVLPDPTFISDLQVQSQIDVLNEDYAGLNADSTRIPEAFKPLFGKSNLKFCLAKIDPSGDGTDGIERTVSDVFSEPGLNDPVKFTCAGGSDAWDPTRYLNIWVCQMPDGFLGYSFFGSDPIPDIPLIERGFVTGFKTFGRGGTAKAPYNLGRTCTHEIGHFFDLDHIWGPNNCESGSQSCEDDDGVDDTPLQLQCNFGSPAEDAVIADECTPDAPGTMWMNYMNYVDDKAMVMYTPGQYNRMEATIQGIPWIQQLSQSTACNTSPLLSRNVRFEAFGKTKFTNCNTGKKYIYYCSELFAPTVVIKNVGTDTVKSLSLYARFGNQTPVLTQWSGSIPPFKSKEIVLNSMNLAPGNNADFKVYTFNPNGSPDQKPVNDTGRIDGVIYPVVTIPYSEGFEQIGFPPDLWQLSNPNGDRTWERTTNASKSGNASMFFNNYESNQNKRSDWIFSPVLTVQGKDSVFVSFQVAAAMFNKPSFNNATDTLEVVMTTDCGMTFKSIYKKWGLQLVTTGDVGVDSSYVPLPSQWRRDSVFLGYYDNSTPVNLQFAFRNITNYENNIYLDDIQVYTKEGNPNLIRKGIMVTPNPSSGRFYLQHLKAPENIEFLSVYNSAGQLVWQQKIAIGQSGTIMSPGKIEINLEGQAPGMYLLQVVYRSRKNETFKLIKSN
jgi:hypothetical protein